MKRRRRGVSLIEILVSMVLLATGVVFALAAITYATKVTSGTTQSTEGTAYARKILELVLTEGQQCVLVGGQFNPAYEPASWRPLYGPEGVAVPFDTSDFVVASDPQDVRAFVDSASKFELRIQVAPYLDPVTSAVSAGLYSVDVQLRYRDRLGIRTISYPGLYREE